MRLHVNDYENNGGLEVVRDAIFEHLQTFQTNLYRLKLQPLPLTTTQLADERVLS